MSLKKHLEGHDLMALYQDLKPWAEDQVLTYPENGPARQILKDVGYSDNALDLMLLYNLLKPMLKK
jgi:hypothetical protein